MCVALWFDRLGQLLLDELPAHECFVDSVKSQERFVVSTLDDEAMLHNDDFVSITDCAQPMSDNDDRLTSRLDESVEGLLN